MFHAISDFYFISFLLPGVQCNKYIEYTLLGAFIHKRDDSSKNTTKFIVTNMKLIQSKFETIHKIALYFSKCIEMKIGSFYTQSSFVAINQHIFHISRIMVEINSSNMLQEENHILIMKTSRSFQSNMLTSSTSNIMLGRMQYVREAFIMVKSGLLLRKLA